MPTAETFKHPVNTAPEKGLVSVIVPCYNNESTLPATLESLAAQRHKFWEAIVVDDGSVDGTSDIISTYAANDLRIRKVEAHHSGPSAARNAGLAAARGDFVMFLDSDDVLLPNALQEMVRTLRRNPEWGAVHCGWWHAQDLSQSPGGRSYCQPTGDLFDHLCRRNLFPICAVMLRRRLLSVIAAFDEKLSAVEDWDFWLQVARTGARFGRLKEVLCLIRVRPGSNTQGARRVFDCSCVLLERAYSIDTRVSDPAPTHAAGGDSSAKPMAIAEAAWSCLGLAIGQGDSSTADHILTRVAQSYPHQVIPQQIGEGARTMIWRGALVQEGHWEELWPKISASLLEFLLRQERVLERPGFGSEVLAHLAGLGLLDRVLRSTSYRLGRTVTRLKCW